MDLASGDAITPAMTLSIDAVSVAIDATGSFAAVGRFRRSHPRRRPGLHDGSRRSRTGRHPGRAAVAFLDDGQLAIGSDDAVKIVDLETLTVDHRFAVPPGSANRAVEPAGSAIITAGDSGIAAIDEGSGALLWTQARDPLTPACTSLTVSTARGAAWCGSDGGDVVEHDLATGSPTARFPQRSGGVFANADGTELVIVGADRTGALTLGARRPGGDHAGHRTW